MACVHIRKDEDFETLMKRFKREVERDQIIQEVRKKEFYVAPALKKRNKRANAEKRRNKMK